MPYGHTLKTVVGASRPSPDLARCNALLLGLAAFVLVEQCLSEESDDHEG